VAYYESERQGMKANIKDVRRVYELHEQGNTAYAIAKLTGLNEDRVMRWIRNPKKFSPYIDETAMMRALEGERRVYDNMSMFEKEEFWRRAYAKSIRSFEESFHDPDSFNKNVWQIETADKMGMKQMSFATYCQRSKQSA
jgi:hypothetical protein